MPQTKIGTVVSDKMQATVVVKVATRVKHPFYKKLITISKKIKAHNDMGAKTQDKVKIGQTRPYSKTVNFKVLEVLKK